MRIVASGSAEDKKVSFFSAVSPPGYLAEGLSSVLSCHIRLSLGKGEVKKELWKGQTQKCNLWNTKRMDYLLMTLTKKKEVDTIIRDTIDKVLVLRFGRSSDTLCLQLDHILIKSVREVSKFATVALVDIDSPDIQVYLKYFDITLIPSTIFFFNAHHMKMDSGNADHTKWVGSFHSKQDFIDVVEAIFRGAMKGKLIVNCPLPQDRTPKYQLLYKEI